MRTWFRALLLGLALVGMALLFTLRSDRASSGGDQIELRFWHGFTSKDGETMLELIRRFNRKNPDIEVQVQRIPWRTYYNKLFVAALADRAPDVFVSHSISLSRMARAGFVEPVDELVRETGMLDVADIEPGIWSATMLDGKHLGVPLDVHPLGLFYNRGLFRKAGLVDASGEAAPPRDWDEFLAAVKALNRDTNGDGHIDQWGFVFEGTPAVALYTFMFQHGGRILSPDGSESVLASPENIAALSRAQKLTAEGLVPPPGDATAWTSFLQGRVGMFLGGVFMVGSLERHSTIDYAAAPVPQFGSQPGVWADSHVLCLPEGLDEKRRAAAWRFIVYLSDHSDEWARGGQIPVRRSRRQSETFQSLPVQTAIAEQIDDVHYLPNVPAIFEITRELRTAFDAILRGAVPPEAALSRAQAGVVAALERDREMAEKVAAWRSESEQP